MEGEESVFSPFPTHTELKSVFACAVGEMPPDILVRGDILDVYTGELLKDHLVAIKGRWITWVGPEKVSEGRSGCPVLDLNGYVLIPGFVDAHVHLGVYLRPDLFLEASIPSGTTTVVTELIDLVFKVGYEGILEFMEGLSGQPIRVLYLAPSPVTLSEEARARGPDPEQLKGLLLRKDVLGLGEGYWQEVLRERERYLALIHEALRLRKAVQGHTAGARGRKLFGYLSLGVSSCHEPITLEEALERLRLGIYVMVREGSVRRDLEEVLKVKDLGVDLRRMVLLSDGLDPDELEEKGYMDYVVQKAIDLGLDPVKAIQMATLNPCEHFGIDNFLGGIAPLKLADIVAIPDLKTVKPMWVIANGKVVLEDGKIKAKVRPLSLPKHNFLKGRITLEQIRVRTDSAIKMMGIELVTDLITREVLLELSPKNGFLETDPKKDVVKGVFLTEKSLRVFFVKGTGMTCGAMATSTIWEAYGVIALGVDDQDLVLALNRVLECGGGIVLVQGGRILEELELPFYGMFSELDLPQVSEKLRSLKSKAQGLGMKSKNPIRTLETLTTPAIPFVRVSERGLIDLKTGNPLPFQTP